MRPLVLVSAVTLLLISACQSPPSHVIATQAESEEAPLEPTIVSVAATQLSVAEPADPAALVSLRLHGLQALLSELDLPGAPSLKKQVEAVQAKLAAALTLLDGVYREPAASRRERLLSLVQLELRSLPLDLSIFSAEVMLEGHWKRIPPALADRLDRQAREARTALLQIGRKTDRKA